jgi:hypothetical protein
MARRRPDRPRGPPRRDEPGVSNLSTLTTEQIAALAPDDQVSKAARGLARPGKWKGLGQRDQALWGDCQGSGKRAYQVAVDLGGPAFKCSCPSRKRPCKHAIGLLLLAQSEPDALEPAELPDWVQKWLAGRAGRATRRAGKASGPVADARAQKQRAARREKRVQQGVDALSLWLEDLVRRGLGSLQSEPPSFWETQAARLVDAQAPGLARYVRQMAMIPVSGEGWPSRLLARLGRLYLLLDAFQRVDGLPPDLQEQVRGEIGWTQDQAALEQQPGERDRWLVLGQREMREDRLRVQRTWLWGVEARRAALVLDFAPFRRPFDNNFVVGTTLDAELVFYPGTYPQRALIKAQNATLAMDVLPGYSTISGALSAYGAAIARNPWLERFLMPLEGLILARHGDGWGVRDRQAHVFPLDLDPTTGWRLLALSGGHPFTLVGEWDGEWFEPLSAWFEGQLISIGGAA